jgi:CBS domain-containing protein
MNLFRFIIPKSLVEYITVDSTVRQGFEKMRFHRYVAIPVLDADGKYVAMLRNDDVLEYFISAESVDMKIAEKVQVGDIVDPSYTRPLYHNATMQELFETVKEHNSVPVVDDRGCFIGIVLRRDVMNFLLRHYDSQERESKHV